MKTITPITGTLEISERLAEELTEDAAEISEEIGEIFKQSSRRDLFAALQGLLSNIADITKMPSDQEFNKMLCETVWQIADQMLKAEEDIKRKNDVHYK